MSASLCPWKAHPSFTADLKSKSLLLMSDVRILRKQWVALCHVLNTLPRFFSCWDSLPQIPNLQWRDLSPRERGEGGRVTPIGLILLGGEKYKRTKGITSKLSLYLESGGKSTFSVVQALMSAVQRKPGLNSRCKLAHEGAHTFLTGASGHITSHYEICAKYVGIEAKH